MTHIENVPHILQNGITHSTSQNSNPDFVPIGDITLIATRNDLLLTSGRNLSEYIPFYFGPRTPMLYVIQNGFNAVAATPAENIVYCVTSIQKIIELGLDYIFSDGHAVDRLSTQYTPKDIEDIEDLVDFNAVKAKYWRDDDDLDLKRRKEAEFLVLGDICVDGIVAFLVYNEDAKRRMEEFGADEKRVFVKKNYYF
jgi:hypothetical protein